ncbi:MAG: hypothetical protein SCH66_01840 [Methanolobus sp.]|nr:hypothetical protein [Methanolobus sp.]
MKLLAILIVTLLLAGIIVLSGCVSDEDMPVTDGANETTDGQADTQNETGPWENTTMQTGQGTTLTLFPQTLKDSRDYRYCELVFDYGDNGSDIYSTSPLAECSEEWWDGLDTDALAEEFSADSVVKNGPQNWSMDEVTVLTSEPIPVADVDMVFGAHLPPGTLETPMYEVFSPAKNQDLVWDAGKPAYELVDPDGNVYVLQGYKVPEESLATLGDDFEELPEGWEYQVVVLDEDLVMNLTTAEPIPSITDEFDQIYIQIPEDNSTSTGSP